MARDVGGYFDQLTKRARGGRRLEGDDRAPTRRDVPEYDPPPDTSVPEQPSRAPSRGGLGDMLKDILGKGTKTAKTTAGTARDRARQQIDKRTSGRRPQSTGSRRRNDLPPEGVVTVEYAPRMDGDPDPGEVVWTWVPFEEDPSQGKDRPVVVIGRRDRGLVGVPLTTKDNDREAQVSIGTGDWDPKRRNSYARIWRMLDIDVSKTRREGAILDRAKFDRIIGAVDEYYDIRRPAPAASDDFDYDY